MLPSRSAPSCSGCPEQVWLLHSALALPDAPSSSPVPSARSSGRHHDSSGEMGQILAHGSCLAGRWHRGPCQHSTAVCGRSTQGQLSAPSSSSGAAAHGQSLHPQQQLCSVSPSTPSPQSHLSSLGIFGPLGPSPQRARPCPSPFWLWSVWPRPSRRFGAALVLFRLAGRRADLPPHRSRQDPAAYGSAMPTYVQSTTRWHIAIVAVFFIFIFSSIIQIRCFSHCSVLSTFETIFVHYYPL